MDQQDFLKSMQKKFGASVFQIPKVDYIPSTSLGLNILTGVGGTPRGRIMEFYGPEGGGKTTIALDYIANANKQGIRCMYIDIEAALDLTWAAKIGVNFDLTSYVRPPNGEAAFDIAVEASKTGLYGLIVFDSVAALVAEAEMEADSISDTKDHMCGYVAKIMSTGLRKLQAICAPTNTGIIFINQVRDNIGVMYGDPEMTPGGRALKFYASVRMRVSKLTAKDTLKMIGDIQVGHRVKRLIKKNKLGAPDSRPAEFDLYYEKGIDQVTELIEWGHKLELIKKRGDDITYKEEKISKAQFIDKVSIPEFRKDIIDQIMAKAHTPILKQSEVTTSNDEKEELFWSSGICKAVILGDTHIPYEDKACIKIVEQIVSDLGKNTKIVFNGDIIEGGEFSRFPKPLELVPWKEELSRVHRFIRQFDGLQIDYLFGNHEDRIRADACEKDRAKSSVIIANGKNIITEALGLSKFPNITSHPVGGSIKLGSLIVTHGEGRPSGIAGTFARSYREKYCKCVMVNHSHRFGSIPITVGPPEDQTIIGAWENGCLCRTTSWYTGGASAQNWQQCLSVVYYEDILDGYFHVAQLPIIRGRVLFNEKVYSA